MMTRFSQHFLFLWIAVCLSPAATRTSGQSGSCTNAKRFPVDSDNSDRAIFKQNQCSQEEFSKLSDTVNVTTQLLAEEIKQAEEVSGVLCDYENITLRVARLFLTYSNYDFNTSGKWQVTDQLGAEIGNDQLLPCRELNKTLDRLARARTELSRLVKNRTLYRRPVPSHRLLGATERSGYFFSANGRPVFPGGYDQGIWKWHYGFSTDVVFEQALSLGQDSLEVAISIASVFPTDGRQPNKSEIALVKSRFDFFEQHGVSAGLVLRCDLPRWAMLAYPQLGEFGGSNCQQNIDEPHLFDLWKTTLTAVYTPLKNHPAVNSVRLGNEVWFSPYSNKTVISQSTLEKWHSWLKEKYKNIDNLNKVYNKTFPSFDNVPIPMRISKSGSASPPQGEFEGTPAGYDLARFNMDRVTNYFAVLIGTLQQINPDIITHIKIVDETTFSSWAFGGVDRYELDEMSQWVGCDTRIMPYPTAQEITPFRNTEQYALDWLAAAIGYTWMRTTSPTKVVVDLEMHAIRTIKVTNDSIADNHMSAALWTAHLHGLGLHLIWSWSRDEYGHPTDGLQGSLNTQPQVMDSYSRALAYINALGPEVHALATRPRPICILWIQAAKTATDKMYMFSLIDMFEALSFIGPSPGFVTAQQLVKYSVPQSCKALLIPVTQYATDQTVATLRNISNTDNLLMFLVGNQSTQVFTKTEMGLERPKSELQWLSKLPLILCNQTPKDLRSNLLHHIQNVTNEQAIVCLDADTQQLAWGILCHSAIAPADSSSVVVALVNVLEKAVAVSLRTSKGTQVTSAVELYMNETLNVSHGLVMQPLDVLLLQVR